VPAPPPLLFPIEHFLQRDDAHGLRERVLAQPGSQQPVRGLRGGPAELGEACAGPAARPVLQPPPGRVIGERPGGELALLAVQRGQE
jgi:hypothetical protein